MNELLTGLLGNADVVIEMAGLPPLVVSLAPGPDDAPPGALVSMLRPAVSLRLNGVQIVRKAPHGEPSRGVPWGVVLVAGAVLGVVVIGWGVARGFSAPR